MPFDRHADIAIALEPFGLALEDVEKAWLPGDDTFFVKGQRVPEAVSTDPSQSSPPAGAR